MQITDLSRSAPFGTARTPVRWTGAWVPRESRPGTCYGTVGPTDDVWAAVRLIYFVHSRGEDLDDLGKLAETGLAQMFNGLLAPVFGPPEGRPTASDLIEYGLRRPYLIPSLTDGSGPLITGRQRFLQARERKHPGAQVPGDFLDDITWNGSRRGTGRPWGRCGVSGIGLITYRARLGGSGIIVVQTDTTILDKLQTDRWQRQLDPWLRAGDPRGTAYLDFQRQAAFIRWRARSGPSAGWEYAHVLVGQSAELTGTYALELEEFDGSRSGLRALLTRGAPGPRRQALEERARSTAAITALVPLLAHTLGGERRVTMPWTAPGFPNAVMWGLISILRMTGDRQPVSFLTYPSAPRTDGDTPGLLVSFHADATAPLPPDQGFAALAADLAHRFAEDPAELRRTLTEHGVPKAADRNGRIGLLLSMPSRDKPGIAYREGASTVSATHGSPALRTDPAVSAVSAVMCPVCLTEIPDWDALEYWKYGSDVGYEKIVIPPDVNRTQRARYQYGAYVRCPMSQSAPATLSDQTEPVGPSAQGHAAAFHHLPARYGRFGEPVLLGFVGLTESGKSHLLASMIGGIGQLSEYQVDVEPLDPGVHHRFLEKSVKPLINHHEALPGTPDDATTDIADAFIVRQGNGKERVVALFDVSGGVLAQTEKTREFLWIADGLFFVIDPDHIESSKVGDDTFSNVLNIVRERVKPEPVSAAIVLSKADKARFEEPVARWLRSGNGTLDPTEFLRESADVYAYLERRNAGMLTEPYRVCQKATLHVASSTGGAKEGDEKGSKYPRGVTPLRVLRPLVAMLAMTGVLTGPQAEMIGV